ncbi:uncharacterized protein BXZ73DRAFT_83406 [Epithele typhae]|uniref:uncharacterized protein n=1 Tax=Epithele typhae TaxID=378194 RepID=UPI002007B08F|nr:uncharacterized protein BXZ73DRAFT_83406 [Epithele typhae]KAH9910609.1 hypothetical protein BXZ73DRAFT_83406 [Epithele typhae]
MDQSRWKSRSRAIWSRNPWIEPQNEPWSVARCSSAAFADHSHPDMLFKGVLVATDIQLQCGGEAAMRARWTGTMRARGRVMGEPRDGDEAGEAVRTRWTRQGMRVRRGWAMGNAGEVVRQRWCWGGTVGTQRSKNVAGEAQGGEVGGGHGGQVAEDAGEVGLRLNEDDSADEVDAAACGEVVGEDRGPRATWATWAGKEAEETWWGDDQGGREGAGGRAGGWGAGQRGRNRAPEGRDAGAWRARGRRVEGLKSEEGQREGSTAGTWEGEVTRGAEKAGSTQGSGEMRQVGDVGNAGCGRGRRGRDVGDAGETWWATRGGSVDEAEGRDTVKEAKGSAGGGRREPEEQGASQGQTGGWRGGDVDERDADKGQRARTSVSVSARWAGTREVRRTHQKRSGPRELTATP